MNFRINCATLRSLPKWRYFAVDCPSVLAVTILALACLGLRSTCSAQSRDDTASTALGDRPDGTHDLDSSKLLADARVVYVSSGSALSGARVNSGGGRTFFRFSGSDLHPTVIFELAQSQEIQRVGAAYPTSAAKLDIYLLNELPPMSGGFLAQKPSASIADSVERTGTAIDIPPTTARYVILRWTRDKASGQPFEVVEINVLGVVSREKEQGTQQTNRTLADSSNFAPPPDPPKIPSLSP